VKVVICEAFFGDRLSLKLRTELTQTKDLPQTQAKQLFLE
tara:strand:- start:239 stop:358 length:120 start_codon:yes stop_codon:yes gene_type:complete